MRIQIIFLTALITVVFTGCKDYANEDLESKKEQSLILKAGVSIDRAVANPENPFDYIGAIHNEGLQALFTYTVSTGDTTRIGKSKALKQFFKKRFDIETKGASNTNLESVIRRDYRLVHRSLQMSPLAHSFVEMMNQSIDNISILSGFNNFRKEFIDLEKRLSSSLLSRYEKDCLLKTASVMRHSAFYWFNFANNNEKVIPMGLLRKLAGIITGIAADGTSALYYVFVSANAYKMLEECIGMSEMCGFYTGGFSYW